MRYYKFLFIRRKGHRRIFQYSSLSLFHVKKKLPVIRFYIQNNLIIGTFNGNYLSCNLLYTKQ